MSPRPGRPADPTLSQRRCEQILACATSFFAVHGYADADLDVLANRIGIGKGTLYRYFPSKEALFLAAVDRGLQGLHQHVETATASGSQGLDRVAAAITAYLTYFSSHPDLIELLILERADFRKRGISTYFQHRQRYIVPWQQLFQQLITQGEVRAVPVEAISSTMGNLLYGALMTHALGGRRTPLADQAPMIVDLLFHGILTPAPTPVRRRAQATP